MNEKSLHTAISDAGASSPSRFFMNERTENLAKAMGFHAENEMKF
jgi:hypothetical protein